MPNDKTSKTYIGNSITRELSRLSMTQRELAERAGLSQAAVSAIQRGDIRPDPETIKKLTSCWPDEKTNLTVLISHLRDELLRAGHNPETFIEFSLPDGHTDTTSTMQDLITLRDNLSDPHCAALVHSLANLVSLAYQKDEGGKTK